MPHGPDPRPNARFQQFDPLDAAPPDGPFLRRHQFPPDVLNRNRNLPAGDEAVVGRAEHRPISPSNGNHTRVSGIISAMLRCTKLFGDPLTVTLCFRWFIVLCVSSSAYAADDLFPRQFAK